MVNAIEWINQKYPDKEEREKIIELDISKQNLEGHLDLNDFVNLETLSCAENKLTSLDLCNLTYLEQLYCRDNYLTRISYPITNNESLIYLSLRNNNLQEQNLSVFSKFVGLRELWIGSDDKDKIKKNVYNRFYGSLWYLRSLSKLEELFINNTDIDSGVEFLPGNTNKIYYSTKERPESKVKEIAQKLDSFVNKKQKIWETFGFTREEINSWMDIGLTINDYSFVNYLKNQKEFSPFEIVGKLEELRTEYNQSWKNISEEFTFELQKQWEYKGFSYEDCKEWIDIGLKITDSDYVKWLKDVKKVDVKWVLNYEKEKKSSSLIFTICSICSKLSGLWKGEKSELKKDYINYSRLNTEVIRQIKDLPPYPNLTSNQEFLINGLISNKELRNRYNKYGLCKECNQPKTSHGWCQPCNSKHFQAEFKNWTSGNQAVDEFIQKYQLLATNKWELFEWIPYNHFWDVEYLAKGGFGTVYKAAWTSGFIDYWDKRNNKWVRNNNNRKIVLKSLDNSRDIKIDFLQEVANHTLFNSDYRVVKCFGISQDPKTKNYIMVMEYVKHGNLKQYLGKNIWLTFRQKIDQLYYITYALDSIHKKGLVHKDFHPGNILLSSEIVGKCHITDLGLSRPVNEREKGKVYGVLPYVAPEVLQGKKYTQASDIYSFGMIMYEVFFNKSPYHDLAHDKFLTLKIFQGLRPNLNDIKIPQLLKSLISKCWDANPLQRPTASELVKILNDWWDEIGYYDKKDTEFYQQYREIEESGGFNQSDTQLSFHQTHPQAIYVSRHLDFKNLPEPQNSQVINEQFWDSKQTDSTIIDLRITTEELDLLENKIETDQTQVEQQFQAQIQIPPKQN